MRIIAGTLRGRLLRGPKGRETTRPITDRVKENLFNILRDAVEDAVVADCFSGTGSLGIEALSRGASSVTFVEQSGQVIGLLKSNLADLDLRDRSRVVREDFLRKGLPELPAPPESPEPPAQPARPYDLVFFDPPYRLTETDHDRLWFKLCEAARAGLLADGAIIIWRHDARQKVLAPAGVEPLAVDNQRTYGSQTLTFIAAHREEASA